MGASTLLLLLALLVPTGTAAPDGRPAVREAAPERMVQSGAAAEDAPEPQGVDRARLSARRAGRPDMDEDGAGDPPPSSRRLRPLPSRSPLAGSLAGDALGSGHGVRLARLGPPDSWTALPPPSLSG